MTERWTIEEVASRYELEPQLSDVYVEGDFDKDLLVEHFHDDVTRDLVFYTVDAVSIPGEMLAAHGFTSGNKQRVIALARELAQRISKPGKYRCLVDRDLDHWLATLDGTANLRWTDYCSIELYFWTPELLRKVLIVAAEAKIEDLAALEGSMVGVLTALYALRLTNESLCWNLRWISFDRCLRAESSTVIFDESEYIKRLLSDNAQLKNQSMFVRELEKWRVLLKDDVRLRIRGHDMVDLLAWVASKFRGGKSFRSRESIERVLVLLAGQAPELSLLVN